MRHVPLRLTDRSRGNRFGREEADLLVSSNSSILDPRSSTFFLSAAVSSSVSPFAQRTVQGFHPASYARIRKRRRCRCKRRRSSNIKGAALHCKTAAAACCLDAMRMRKKWMEPARRRSCPSTSKPFIRLFIAFWVYCHLLIGGVQRSSSVKHYKHRRL